jgi:hypothetical protein
MIKFIDYNKSLVEKVRKLNIEAVCGDYFFESYKTPRPVLMTASNPHFTFGGGLGYHFTKHFPELCKYKQIKCGENERIGNICFAITVDENLKATKEMIKSALEFSIPSTCEHETLCFSGIGTGIGGLSEDEFISVLKGFI